VRRHAGRRLKVLGRDAAQRSHTRVEGDVARGAAVERMTVHFGHDVLLQTLASGHHGLLSALTPYRMQHDL